MAKKAIYILEDEDRLNTFKNNAYIFAERFSLNSILPLYEEIYRSVKVGCC